MTRGSTGRSARRGFTLIEAMATVTVLAVLGSIAMFLLVDTVTQFSDATRSAQLHRELSVGLDRAIREIRNIPLDDDDVGPSISSFDADEEILWTDIDDNDDGLLYSAGTLSLRNDGTDSTLLTDLTACTFTAYDEDNGALGADLDATASEAVRRVLIDVTIERNGTSESLRTKVYIRSMMEGS